jgi:gamma-carbonic anhydrase
MIHDLDGKSPQIHADAFVHPDATVIGDATIAARASIWPTTVLRADMGRIVIGEDTSVQDGTIIHLTEGWSETVVGARVTIGHRVILHGCTVGDDCLIGMGSILLDNATIGRGSLVAAGSLVPVGMQVPEGSFVRGSPAVVVGPVKEHHTAMIDGGWRTYTDYARRYKSQLGR